MIKVVMTDGTEYDDPAQPGVPKATRINLDIDSKSHPAWTGGNQQNLLDRGGRLVEVQQAFRRPQPLRRIRSIAENRTRIGPGGFFVVRISISLVPAMLIKKARGPCRGLCRKKRCR
jgi:large subunit ribosomal protein L31